VPKRIRILAFAGVVSVVTVAVTLALAVSVLWIWSPGTTSPILDEHGEERVGSVAEIVDVPLGGVSQFVLIRGRDRSNPVLLLLHGGPGDPAAAQFLAYNSALEDHFVVVHWDQRGAGASYSDAVPDETMTVDQLVSDTHELTRYLEERFEKSKIFLAGHSWGSYLGMRVVHRYPDDYYAFVGMGQVANQPESEARSYATVLDRAKASGRDDAVRELEALGRPDRGRYAGGLAGLGRQRKWVREFGGAAYGRTNIQALWMLARPLLVFREYRLEDKLNYIPGEDYSMSFLEESLLDDDLTQSATELEVPIFFLQGRHDLQTVFETTRDYFEVLRAPQKEFIVFENSAHLVPFEEPEKFLRVMVERVRPLAN
jgi:pimeloyl-ACP methyl ester carboxylesterase